MSKENKIIKQRDEKENKVVEQRGKEEKVFCFCA